MSGLEEVNNRITSEHGVQSVEDNYKYLIPKIGMIKDKRFSFSFQELALWLLIFMLIGISMGAFSAREYYTFKIGEAVKVQGVVHDGRVFDVLPSATKK